MSTDAEVPEIEIEALAFEVITNVKENKLGLIVSADTHLVVTFWDFALAHEMCGRLLGGLMMIDRDATLEALRSTLAANTDN